MAEICKVYKQRVGNMRFIGKKYLNSDRVNGMFGAKWGEWFENGWFTLLEKHVDGSLKDTYEDGDATIGLMREENGFDSFEYWIGYFVPENTKVPEGFTYVDFPESELGVCWVYGKVHEVFGLEGMCRERLEKEGYEVTSNWCIERYSCPRFTTPDEKGNVIIDICFFVK
ncbi:MAG: GyrI-like domain-containing protein [Lachnospiraceae bacterium]|jgi:predicted transcriptional regulator YdeE|nr:GyrI-like domain-containing protein [Lachnospiraceae bacterium]